MCIITVPSSLSALSAYAWLVHSSTCRYDKYLYVLDACIEVCALKALELFPLSVVCLTIRSNGHPLQLRHVFCYHAACTCHDTTLILQTCIRPSRPWLPDAASGYIQSAYEQDTIGRFDAVVFTLLRIYEVPLSNSCIGVTFFRDGFRSFPQSLREDDPIVLWRLTSIDCFQTFCSASFIVILLYATRNTCIRLSIIK
jgi:hypothetical protein